ncbi:MAG: phosphate acyltransferase [Bacteroidetes bacterium GWF2_38_335]|nr:MAG: phosphate acyltransferase [Bacteroidetes bacterium GWF2_38_335]OFY81315.1 MAG: phosphate acyltransferase [Bacteroidetes bacterium RIFOXYA12_FULL_38_20]HBS85436.1 phosphate--acyl-ACP acyltransferase [Bacteroidales bacterium]
MKIGLDIMGGDYAPEAATLGAILARNAVPSEVELVLIGREDKILEILKRENVSPSGFHIVNTSEVIEMGDHPAKTFSKKTDSSIVKGFELLKSGEIDGFASAGNTGAMLVGAMYTVKSAPGVIRPCIASPMPKDNGKFGIILDVGLNPDCKPDVLYQYGLIGSIYTEYVYGIKRPRVGLVNIGEEEEKGSLLTKSTYELMKDNPHFNFVGNVEGNDLFSDDKADVFVCDGFTGNVILKEAEGFYNLLKKRRINDPFIDENFNFEKYGGTPVLGINSTVIIGHGISNANAIKNMVLQTVEVVEAKISDKIKEAFK